MLAYQIRESFGLENLRRVEVADPQPGPGEIRIRVRAVSLNYRDLLTVRGTYNPRQPLPLIPCSDGAGVVESAGEGVSRVRVGDRVCPIFAQRWISGTPTAEKLRSTLGGPLPGALAQYVVVHQEGVVPVPEHMSDEEAATLPCAALTAWSALTTHGEVKAGDTVLVLGTGGVAIFALQIARLLGARVVITSSSDEKLQRALELGAADGVNYLQEPDWGRAVRQLTGGVDVVVELGGAGTLAQSLEAVRFGGRICLIGVLSGVQAPLLVAPALMKQVRIQGLLVGHREGFEAMNVALELHRVRPVIDRVFPFAEAAKAFDHLASGRHFGKVCIGID